MLIICDWEQLNYRLSVVLRSQGSAQTTMEHVVAVGKPNLVELVGQVLTGCLYGN